LLIANEPGEFQCQNLECEFRGKMPPPYQGEVIEIDIGYTAVRSARCRSCGSIAMES
jgi:hypothetical protein